MLPTERLPITIDGTPQPLLLQWMTGGEELGRLFEYHLEIYSEKQDLVFADLLGKPMTVCLAKLGGNRFFNGIVTRLWRVGTSGRYLVLRVVLSPKLWLLRRTSDCRVYQKKTVPQVVKEVLGEHAIMFSERLAGAYGKWDYLTQYRESDFAFISRIMEREGIYYYFKHTQTTHELVLSDSMGSHDPREQYTQIPIRPVGSAQSARDHFTGWRLLNDITSIGATLQAHDFRLRRGANIKATAGAPAEHDQDEFQLYDYPGHYVGAQNEESVDATDIRISGEHFAQVQLDEQRSDLERLEAEGNVLGLETGAVFQFDDLTAPADKFLVVATHHDLRNAAFESSQEPSGDREICHMSCSALNSARQFRPKRITAKAVAAGPESAIVVGPPGEEIHTDKYGRVRVQFRWDREGKLDESSTCWVRVGQMWAGSNWGSQFIPRVGHEVIVQFLGGDPDRPIITGSVYNADNMPPYTLPAHATQSGIKSRSTKGGAPANFNEIRFEDKKGSEEIYVHAERNQTIEVKASRSVSVGGSESITVSGTRSTTVNKKDTVTLKDEHNMTVTQMASQYFKNGHIQNVYGADQEMFVEMGKTEYVTKIFSMESAEEIVLKVGESQISIKPDEIEIKSATVTIKGPTMVNVVGGVIKLNSP
jgi:type VI secretion system secreted protein VgrG